MKLSIRAVAPLLIFLLVPAVHGATISTPFTGGNTFAGNMFDVTNLTLDPVQILGTFRVNISGAGPSSLSVYYRSGSYVGFESSPDGWTLLGTDTGVTPLGVNQKTPIDVGNSFFIGGGGTYGFYVTVSDYPSSSMQYTNGNLTVSDGTLQIVTGIGKGDPDFTGATFTPRIWNGEIDYAVGSAAIPEPSSLVLMGFGFGCLALLRKHVFRA